MSFKNLHFPVQPIADSIIEPFSWQSSWHNHITVGAINSGFNCSNKSKNEFEIFKLIILSKFLNLDWLDINREVEYPQLV